MSGFDFISFRTANEFLYWYVAVVIEPANLRAFGCRGRAERNSGSWARIPPVLMSEAKVNFRWQKFREINIEVCTGLTPLVLNRVKGPAPCHG